MTGDLAPRKGHFSLSPWQRHGKTAPKKNTPKGHANMRGPSEKVASSLGAPAGLSFFITDQTHGVAMGCEWPARGGKLRLLLRVGISTLGEPERNAR
jgi:hypothetical protein